MALLFHKEIVILIWALFDAYGTKLEETLIEFYHTENIDGNKVTHEYIYDQDIVNEVQPVTVKVHYQLFTFTNTYELLIVD